MQNWTVDRANNLRTINELLILKNSVTMNSRVTRHFKISQREQTSTNILEMKSLYLQLFMATVSFSLPKKQLDKIRDCLS